MTPNVGINITCNTNCSHWCPRILRIFCCCKVDSERNHTVHKVDETAKKSETFSSDKLPKIDEDKPEEQNG